MEILLVIISTGLFGRYAVLMEILLVICVLFMVIKKRKIIIIKNINFLFLILFAVSYQIFGTNNENKLFISIIPIFAYLCGYIIFSVGEKTEKKGRNYILAIATGLFIHMCLNFIINLNNNVEYTIDIWLKTYLVPTLQGTFITILMSIAFWIYTYCKNMKVKVIYTVMIVIALIYVLKIACRATIVISIVVFIIEGLIYTSKKGKIKKLLTKAVLFIIALIPIVVFYEFDFFELKTKFEESNFAQKIEYRKEYNSSDDTRFAANIEGFQNLFKYPFGYDEKVGQLNYCHNMWLDIGKEAGIFSFIFLGAFSVSTFIKMMKLCRKGLVTDSYKVLISSVYLGVNINFFIEPILQGVPFFFILFVLINGIIDSQYTNLNEKLNYN